MKGIENQTYLWMLIASNVIAILVLCCAWWRPRIGRALFFLLFGWACWMNWTTALRTPAAYLQYADMSLLSWYAGFIRGWFSEHVLLLVGTIATCQGLIALCMLLKGWIYKLDAWAALLSCWPSPPWVWAQAFPARSYSPQPLLYYSIREKKLYGPR